MNKKEIIFKWLDGIFDKKVPDEVQAVYINLVESINLVEVEFFGIGKFDPNDIDWACYDIYQADSVEISYDEEISNIWENVLKEVASFIADYIDLKSGNSRLMALKRVGIGFGDSEIILVKDEI